MILEKLNKKVNLKKIYIVILLVIELGKIAKQTRVHGGSGGGRKGRWLE